MISGIARRKNKGKYMNIKDNMQEIRSKIEKSWAASPIAAKEVTLLAASKTQDIAKIEEAIAAGITCFGENRVQEAQEKWGMVSSLRGGVTDAAIQHKEKSGFLRDARNDGELITLREKYPHIQLHLIGALQTNKAKQALQLFDVIQTLDRVELAEAIAKIRKTNNGGRTTEFYIQVNTGEEPQKSGVLPQKSDEFIKYCIRDLHLPVVGLMCVPPADQPPAPHFALLREIALRNNLRNLSMGMSGDYETAVRMGASCVRVGSGIFGERPVLG